MKKRSLIEKMNELIELLEHDPVGQHGMIVIFAKEICDEYKLENNKEPQVKIKKDNIPMPNQKRHDEGWEKHLQEWEALEQRISYRKNTITPLKDKLAYLVAIKNKNIQIWTEIRQIIEELKFTPEDLFSNDDKNKGNYIKNFEPSKLRRLASYIHLYKCKSKIHTEDCGWFYEDNDNDSLHKRYLGIAKLIVKAGIDIDRLISDFKNYYEDNRSDTNFIEEALSKAD